MTRLLGRLEGRVWWHRLLRHRVFGFTVTGGRAGTDPGQMRMWNHYCQDCEIAW